MVFCSVSQDSHMSENIWYLSFSDWLISVSIIPSCSIHVAANGMISFFLICYSFFLMIQYSIVHINHIAFIHLSVDGYVGSFHNLATVERAKTLRYLCPYESALLYPLGKLLVVLWLGHRVVLLWIFEERPHCFPERRHQFAERDHSWSYSAIFHMTSLSSLVSTLSFGLFYWRNILHLIFRVSLLASSLVTSDIHLVPSRNSSPSWPWIVRVPMQCLHFIPFARWRAIFCWWFKRKFL